MREEQTLSFTCQATDPDALDTKTWSLTAGVGSINSSSGVYSYTPGLGTAGTVSTVVVRCTDNGTPNLYDEKQFTVTVTPALEVTQQADVTFAEGETLELQFTLAAGNGVVSTRWTAPDAPPNFAIDESTGAASWRAVYGQAGTYTIRIRCEDIANPGLYDDMSFTAIVVYGPKQPFKQLRGATPQLLRFSV